MFTSDVIRTHIARIEREQREQDAVAAEDDDELLRENPATAVGRSQRFATIKELLIAPDQASDTIDSRANRILELVRRMEHIESRISVDPSSPLEQCSRVLS